MRGGSKDKHKVCFQLQNSICLLSPISPLAPGLSPPPLFHTYAWALLCTQFVQIGFGLAVECLASEKKWPPSAFPALYSPESLYSGEYMYTHIRACMLIQSQTINLGAGRILKRLIQYGRRFAIQTLAIARSESPSAGLSVCVCLGKSLVRDTYA